MLIQDMSLLNKNTQKQIITKQQQLFFLGTKTNLAYNIKRKQ